MRREKLLLAGGALLVVAAAGLAVAPLAGRLDGGRSMA
jgi:hypothetical protein